MNDLEKRQRFQQHYERDRRALSLQGRIAIVAGGGTMGSLIGAAWAHAGGDVLFLDHDRLERSNLLRHYLRDERLIGQHKATALAAKIQSEVPELQRIRGLVADLEALTWEEYRTIVRGAAILIDCTARDNVATVLETLARELRIPFLAPSLWAGTQPILGDLLVSAWSLPNRRGACLACLRPPQPTATANANAQPGLEAEVQRIASTTAAVAVTLLLPESEQHVALRAQLERGANYMLFPRWPPTVRTVRTRPRPDCRTCSQAIAGTNAPAAAASDVNVGELTAAVLLGSVVLWHQAVPGFDAVATIAFVSAIGLWWRGRLPSYEDVAARVRRLWNGR